MSPEEAAAIVKTMTNEQISAVMTYMLEGDDRSFFLPALTIFTTGAAKLAIECNAAATEFKCDVKHKGKKYKARMTITVKETKP